MLATAKTRVARLSTKQLLEIRREVRGRTPEVAQVRGWILDELESRNKQAFNAWLDSSEPHPDEFFLN